MPCFFVAKKDKQNCIIEQNKIAICSKYDTIYLIMELKEIAKDSKTEIVINKSKFFAYSFACHSLKDVDSFIDNLKKEHSTATHICYAYKIQPNQEKCNDDGEPQGTAGKPILDVIKKSKYENLLVAVVRYFGGVKLGAGGLVRAYSSSASSVLDISGEKLSVECKKIKFKILLNESKFTKLFQNIASIKKIDIFYEQDILIEIYAQSENMENIESQIQNILTRKIQFETSDETIFV